MSYSEAPLNDSDREEIADVAVQWAEAMARVADGDNSSAALMKLARLTEELHKTVALKTGAAVPETEDWRGYKYAQLLERGKEHPSYKLEKAFSDTWTVWNEGVDPPLQVLMEDVFEIPDDMRPEYRKLAGTVIQWLGTEDGLRFLAKALESVDYAILRSPADALRKSRGILDFRR